MGPDPRPKAQPTAHYWGPIKAYQKPISVHKYSLDIHKISCKISYKITTKRSNLTMNSYLGSYTYYISSAGWGFPILAAAAFMRALRVRLSE
ncbi:hypothetical protein ACN42_g10151 [Penicillium freii]|uniref:Uncharacterized protein n=1 Tax=Penicillium freii TaxID=48697 RepID=A0A124GQ54_PENFR|nr:hypothetical protein ACN42_g10151 [Penicillium freii]